MTVTWSEPCDLSDTDLITETDPDERPAEQWADIEDVDTGEWL
ncbi:hypothetical protein [Streptomyces venezuelae]|nr:hypothetical protein [Streptomyces venezuelae]